MQLGCALPGCLVGSTQGGIRVSIPTRWGGKGGPPSQMFMTLTAHDPSYLGTLRESAFLRGRMSSGSPGRWTCQCLSILLSHPRDTSHHPPSYHHANHCPLIPRQSLRWPPAVHLTPVSDFIHRIFLEMPSLLALFLPSLPGSLS